MKKNRIAIWIITTIAFTAGICYIFSFFPESLPFDSFSFAFELHFILMFWFAFSTPKLQLNYQWKYFLAKPFEKSGKIYKYFGVNLFRKLLRFVGWEKVTESMNAPVKYDVANLKDREKNTRASEFSHLVIAGIVFLLIFILTDSIKEAKWLIITNIIFHIYPVIVQRYNRPRYLRAIKLLENRSEKKIVGN